MLLTVSEEGVSGDSPDMEGQARQPLASITEALHVGKVCFNSRFYGHFIIVMQSLAFVTREDSVRQSDELCMMGIVLLA